MLVSLPQDNIPFGRTSSLLGIWFQKIEGDRDGGMWFGAQRGYGML